MSLAESYPSHDPDWVAEIHATQYLQSWSKQGGKPRVITGAEGSWFWDNHGKRYLDFESQLVNLNMGHQHPKSVEAISRPIAFVISVLPWVRMCAANWPR